MPFSLMTSWNPALKKTAFLSIVSGFLYHVSSFSATDDAVWLVLGMEEL